MRVPLILAALSRCFFDEGAGFSHGLDGDLLFFLSLVDLRPSLNSRPGAEEDRCVVGFLAFHFEFSFHRLGSSGTRVLTDFCFFSALERISVPTEGTGHTISASLTGVGARYSAHGEVHYLRRLVDKYGEDMEKMARDRKLNPEQRTAGELGRALKRAGIV